jgi:hypothetical protein
MRTVQGLIVNLLYFSLSICGISCGDLLLPPLEVISIHAEDDVKILFSAQPSTVSIRRAFSLTEDGMNLSGDFLFDGKYVVFTPVNGIQKNHEYAVTITTIAEDEKGNSLLNDFVYQFYTKPVTEPPVILSVFPENESIILTELSAIVFTFSKSVSEHSFTRAFKISPSVNYLLEWNPDFTSVTVRSASPLAYGRYTISVSTDLSDEHGNEPPNPFTSTFLYGTDTDEPEYTAAWKIPNDTAKIINANTITDNIPADAEIHISFNETVAIESIAGFFTITPSIGFTVTPDLQTRKDIVIAFSERPSWLGEYTLTIRKGIEDMSGNKTGLDTRYTLIFDNSVNKPVLFKGAFFKTDKTENLYKPINYDTNYTGLTLAADDFQQKTLVNTDFYAVFNISPDSENILVLPSAMQNISITTTNGCVSMSLKTMKVLTEMELSASDIYQYLTDEQKEPGYILCAIKMGIEVYNENKNGLVTFLFGQDISDSLGNKMTADFSFTYSKQ